MLYRRLSSARGVLFTPHISSFLSPSLFSFAERTRHLFLYLPSLSLPLLPFTTSASYFLAPYQLAFRPRSPYNAVPPVCTFISLTRSSLLSLYKIFFLSRPSTWTYPSLVRCHSLSRPASLPLSFLFISLPLLRLRFTFCSRLLFSTPHPFFLSFSLQLALPSLPPYSALFIPSASTVHPRWLGAKAEH